MGLLKKIAFTLASIIIVALGIGFLLPSEYKVERSVVIQAPIDVVFDQVNDLKKNEAWSPWKDSTMKITYGDITVGKGATSSWESKNMGNGSQTIEESVPNASIRTYLDFKEMGHAYGHWTFKQEGEGVQVTQGMSGDQGMNPVKRYFALMMDKMIGPYFEQGLTALKQVSEAQAAVLEKAKAEAEAAAAAQTADSSATPSAAP